MTPLDNAKHRLHPQYRVIPLQWIFTLIVGSLLGLGTLMSGTPRGSGRELVFVWEIGVETLSKDGPLWIRPAW